MEVALPALGTQQRAGKGSAAGERMANKEDICFLSWMWQPVVGCTEGQRGAVTAPPTRPRRLIQRPKGAFIKTTPFCMFCITVAYPESKKTEAMKPAQGALSPRHRMSHCNCLQGLVLETCYNE